MSTYIKALLILGCLQSFIQIARGQVTADATRVCYGDSSYLYNTSTIAKQATTQWDLDNDGFYDDGTGDTLAFVFPKAGENPVGLKITDSLGTSYYLSLPLLVMVDTLPGTDFSLSKTCLGDSTHISYSAANPLIAGLSYNWDLYSDGSIDATSADPSFLLNSVGTDSVTLQVESLQGCTASSTKSITVFSNPAASFSSELWCAGNPSVFTNTSTSSDSIDQVVWRLGEESLSFDPIYVYHQFDSAGNYMVSLSLRTINGCSDSISEVVTIPIPGNFQLNLSDSTTIYEGNSATAEIAGNFTRIEWMDGNTENPRVITDPGFYQVTALFGATCSASDSFTINTIPKPESIDKAKDIITPNGDGYNDHLEFSNLMAFQNCEVHIYDVRGREIYSNPNYQNDWNASINGGLVNPGVYFYTIQCDNTELIKGYTNVLW